MNIDPIEQIKKAIDQHKSEAKWARENAERLSAQAEAETVVANEHSVAAYKWRKILEREEGSVRTVTVKLDVDTSAVTEMMQQLAESGKKLGPRDD